MALMKILTQLGKLEQKQRKNIREFLNQALKIPSTHAIAVSDAHRLLQHVVTKQGKRITQPIIV